MCKTIFSVLIANYNNGQYLQEAINSVLKQTYINWEVIIVDDASTDNSFEIYAKYANDPRFNIYKNKKNYGCGYTKRRCIELSNGDLCGFLDSDDALEPNAIEKMVFEHSKHPECSLIYSTCYRYSGNKSLEMPIWDYIGAIPDDEDFLICQKKLVSHFVTFKKLFYNQTVGMDVNLRCAEDKDLYYKLEEVGKLLYLPIPLYYYRINNCNSVSIGTDEKDVQAYYYNIIADLNAICRRMGSELFVRNKDSYMVYMREILRVYYKSNLFDICTFFRYCFYYLKGNEFSIQMFNHLRKIPFGR